VFQVHIVQMFSAITPITGVLHVGEK